LSAILTQQKDAGMRARLGNGVTAVVGLFDLRRPYFGFDTGNLFKQIGTVRSRGVEFSITGSLTDRLDIVAGGMLLDPKVSAANEADATIGSKPVGLMSHLLIGNVNWKTPFVRGLELDLALSHRGRTPATTDNFVTIPPRARLDIGTHYRFDLARRSATLRLQLTNVFDKAGYGLAGSGAYLSNPGRSVQGYLTIDL
jgi:iron complex outermembrane receptor protein